MKRKRNRSESNYVRRKINRWTRFLAKERDWDYTFMFEIEYRGITNILYKSNFKVIPPTNNFFYVIIVFVYFLLFLLFCILYQPLLVKA